MPDRILIVERDPDDPLVWRYGLADADGQLPADAFQLSNDGSGPSRGAGSHEESLWVTASLLVRPAGEHDRLCTI